MASFEKVVQELTKMKAVTRPRSQTGDDFDLQVVTMARGMADIADAALEDGCSAWAVSSQWFPTLAELRAECVKYQPVPKREALPKPAPEWRPSPGKRERARVAYGLRRLGALFNASDTKPEEWDALKAEMARMQAEDSLPPEVRDAIG